MRGQSEQEISSRISKGISGRIIKGAGKETGEWINKGTGNEFRKAISKGKINEREMSFLPLLFLSLLVLILFFSPVCSAVPAAEAASYGEEKLSIILIDGDDLYVRSGDSHTFYQGYQLYVKGADAEASRVWLELRRDGISLEDTIATEGTVIVYSRNSTEFLNLTVDTIYMGTDGVLVKFSPVYQYLDPKFPRPQSAGDSLPESPENNSSQSGGAENRAKGFEASSFFLSFGAVLLFTGFFAGRSRKKK